MPFKVLEQNICRGAILHSDIFEDIDHGKFFVIMGISHDFVAGFFYINSNIHSALFNKPSQLAMQYLVKKVDYPFLRYDSFVCASSLIKIKRKDLARSIAEGRTCFVADMKPSHMDELREAALHSTLFSKAEKREFFD